MPTINKHIEILKTLGLRSTIYVLTGRVDFKRLGRHFNMMVKRRHPEVSSYHFFWFRTGDSVVVSYVGNIFLLDAVEDFMAKAVTLGIAGDSEEVFTSKDKDSFMAALMSRLQNFSPKPLTRSYGGSQLG